MINVVAPPDPGIRYVFEFIFGKFNHLESSSQRDQSKDKDALCLYYGPLSEIVGEHDLTILQDAAGSPEYGDLCMLAKDEQAFRSKYFAQRGRSILITFDIVAVILFFLSRKEEYDSCETDEYGRFPTENLLLTRLGLLDFPVVDALISLLVQTLEEIALAAGKHFTRKRFLPANKKYVVCLTHDVDFLDGRTWIWLRYANWLYRGIGDLGSSDPARAKIHFRKIVRWLSTRSDPHFTIPNWLSLEKKYGVRSTFFFLASRFNASLEGRRYNIQSKKVRGVLNTIRAEGFELALHTRRRDYLSKPSVQAQKTLLENAAGCPIRGVRQDYLNLKVPDSFRLFEELQFKYDSTLGPNDDEFGFRAGTARPFYPYDLARKRRAQVQEIPLILMDIIFDIKRLNSTPESIASEGLRFVNIARRFGGVITLLFHPERWDEVDFPNYRVAYELILQSLTQDSDALILPAGEVADVFTY